MIERTAESRNQGHRARLGRCASQTGFMDQTRLYDPIYNIRPITSGWLANRNRNWKGKLKSPLLNLRARRLLGVDA